MPPVGLRRRGGARAPAAARHGADDDLGTAAGRWPDRAEPVTRLRMLEAHRAAGSQDDAARPGLPSHHRRDDTPSSPSAAIAEAAVAPPSDDDTQPAARDAGRSASRSAATSPCTSVLSLPTAAAAAEAACSAHRLRRGSTTSTLATATRACLSGIVSDSPPTRGRQARQERRQVGRVDVVDLVSPALSPSPHKRRDAARATASGRPASRGPPPSALPGSGAAPGLVVRPCSARARQGRR